MELGSKIITTLADRPAKRKGGKGGKEKGYCALICAGFSGFKMTASLEEHVLTFLYFIFCR